MIDSYKIIINSKGIYDPIIEDRKPKYAVPLIETPMMLCCYSMKDECPYAVGIKIDTEFLNFNHVFCGYAFKK